MLLVFLDLLQELAYVPKEFGVEFAYGMKMLLFASQFLQQNTTLQQTTQGGSGDSDANASWPTAKGSRATSPAAAPHLMYDDKINSSYRPNCRRGSAGDVGE
jgi:hypothetical protein